MKKIILVLFLFASEILAFGQGASFSLTGRVIDSASGQPLGGASVFCPNTTHGTVSNNDGLFYLRLPAGGYDLVVSYTGYARYLTRISNTSVTGDTMVVVLAKEDKSMSEVAVVGSTEVPDGWTKYGDFFLKNFIGNTPNSGLCKLQNPEALHFYYTKKRNRLKVTASDNLVIMNYALGYQIRYQLDSFTYYYATNISQYTGFPLFVEMDSTREVKSEWLRNRARTYLGSRLHFMRSMYDSTASDEGFIVEKLSENPSASQGSILRDLYDSSYYNVDSNRDVTIGWDGRYRVSYKSVLPDKRFLEEYKLPSDIRMQITVVTIDDGFSIKENGYFWEQYDLVNTGYWAWKKLAELLPYDYTYQ